MRGTCTLSHFDALALNDTNTMELRVYGAPERRQALLVARLAARPRAAVVLALAAFAEALSWPLLPELTLAALVLAGVVAPRTGAARWFASSRARTVGRLVLAAGAGSVLGGLVTALSARHGRAEYGAWLDDEDRRRRFVLMHLLQSAGLSARAYAERFGAPLLDDLPELEGLGAAGLAAWDGDRLPLTEAGLERSDPVGP